MGFINNSLKLFGINIDKQEDNLSAALTAPSDEDGSIVTAASGAGSYGIYLDIDGTATNDIILIKKYRDISLYPEIDLAIQDIINEAIPQETDSKQVELITDDLDVSDSLKEVIKEEFEFILKKLDYSDSSSDLFRRWYIDGRLVHQILVDRDNPKLGIQDLRLIDSTLIRKIKEVKKKKTAQGIDVIDGIDEYFVYNESGFSINSTTGQYNNSQGVKISSDSIVFVPSGYVDQNNKMILSYLNKAIRPANQLRMLEDATIVYFIARAPERRIFYVDVGNMPKMKAESYIKDMMNRYRNKMVYDSNTGDVKNDKKYFSMLEDYWMPRQSGSKSTEISTLEGASNITGMLDNVEYFKNKLYQALNIPIGRIKPDQGFSIGRTTEISRDELKFQKYINRLRNKFSQLFYETLRVQLILKGIVNNKEWDYIKENIRFSFQSDNYFTEMKRLDIIQARAALLPQLDQYESKYVSKKYIQSQILGMTDDQIEKMNKEIEEEKLEVPAIAPISQQFGQGQDQTNQDPSMPQDDQRVNSGQMLNNKTAG